MNNLFPQVQKGSRIAVISHINPDGDSLGSLLGLSLALKKQGAAVTTFVNDDVPQKYRFLPQIDQVIRYDLNQRECFDICFVLDCGDEKRLGYSIDLLKKGRQIVNIDHHVSNAGFGDINILDPEASSTCEMIYRLITQEMEVDIDKAMAICLYTGIVTDTGNFRYDSTSPETHHIAGALLEKGVELKELTYHLHQNNTFGSMKLLGHLLAGLKTYFDGKVAVMEVTHDLLKAYQVQYDEVEGMINYARDIKGVEVAVILKELEAGEVKISLRSKTTFDVSRLAQTFGGGGHKKASGAVMAGTIQEVKDQILDKIQRMI